MTTLKVILRQIIAVFFIAAGFLSMTASAAHASNIFISDTVTADETNENKTIAVWLDASPGSGNVTVTYYNYSWDCDSGEMTTQQEPILAPYHLEGLHYSVC